jgi:hypothetical protein
MLLRRLGLTLLLLEVHAINLLSALHAWWARLMLGSRAPHIVPGAPLGDLPSLGLMTFGASRLPAISPWWECTTLPDVFGSMGNYLKNAGWQAGERWGRDLWRMDAGLGYRFTPHTQLKLQYSLQHEDDGPRDLGHLLGVQFTLRF